MSRRMFLIIVILFVMGGAITGCGNEETIITPVSAETGQAQIKAQAMADAAYYNSIIVVFNKTVDPGDDYAICNGTQRVVGLDAGETRRAELSSQEALNASLCKWNEASGRYISVQDIGGTSPGDYLEWDGTSFGITPYTP